MIDLRMEWKMVRLKYELGILYLFDRYIVKEREGWG